MVVERTVYLGRIYEKTFYDSVAAGDKVQDIVPAVTGYKARILGIRTDDTLLAHSAGQVSIYSDDATAVVAYSSVTSLGAGGEGLSMWADLNVVTTATGKKWTLKHASGAMTYAVRYCYEE